MRNSIKVMKYKKMEGFSIVELMVAMLIGLLLLTSLISVFDTSSRMNRTQNGLARLQENGRYAMLQLKQNIEQAGYQYCLGSKIDKVGANSGVNIQPIVVFTNNLSDGMPTRANVDQTPAPGVAPLPYLVDPAYFIHGHECGKTTCLPNVTSIGTPNPSSIPDVGTAAGKRLAGTDILSFRYYSGKGREIKSINTSSGAVSIDFTKRSKDHDTNIPLSGSKVVIASCTGPSKVVSLTSSTAAQAFATISPVYSIDATSADMAKMFDIAGEISSVTYYVANDIVDGRDVPTLYSMVNGTTNAIIQGVDRFDVLYGVKLKSGATRILDANGVQDLPAADCLGKPSYGASMKLNNATGCGWRSVVTIEIHLLLNTVFDSSHNDYEQFVYSVDGTSYQSPGDLKTGINYYNMYRREFMTSITLKNF